MRAPLLRRDILGMACLGVYLSTSESARAETTALARPDSRLSLVPMPEGVRRTISAPDGTALATHEYGNPNGATILFVHGWSQCHLSWYRQVTDTALLDRYRMIALDLRGHGASGSPPGRYRPKIQADDVRAVVDGLALRGVTLVGWSFGGVVVLDYLHAHGFDGVAGAVFVGSGIGDVSQPELDFFGPGLRPYVPGMTGLNPEENAATTPSIAANLTATVGFLSNVPRVPMPYRHLVTALAYNMAVTPAARLSTISRVDGTEPPQDYHESVMPAMKAAGLRTLVVGGEDDTVMLHAAAELIAERTGGRLIRYADTGHAPMIERPERFNADLATFVG